MKNIIAISIFTLIVTISFTACVSRQPSVNESSSQSSEVNENSSSSKFESEVGSSTSSNSISNSIDESSSQPSNNSTANENSSNKLNESSSSSTIEETSSSQANETSENKSPILLVNIDNALEPENYVPQLTMLTEGHYLETETAKAYWKMVNAASNNGISIWCASGYRSYDLQKKLWDKRYAANLQTYNDKDTAFEKTLEWTAYPGRSEHQTGMAVDFNMVDTSFETTKEAKWLYEHAAEYGFILRYPKGKTEITKTSYEPWHFRYVGTEYAQKIEDSGLCLEEYIEQMMK